MTVRQSSNYTTVVHIHSFRKVTNESEIRNNKHELEGKHMNDRNFQACLPSERTGFAMSVRHVNRSEVRANGVILAMRCDSSWGTT